jgi:hypothetical protein
MLFMYITTLAATLVTMYNLYTTIATRGGTAAVGAWAMIIISLLLFIAALLIAWDGYKAYQRYASGGETPKVVSAPTGD